MSAFDTWYVSGNSNPSRVVTPGGRSNGTGSPPPSAVARNASASSRGDASSSRSAICWSVNPSGNVTRK